MWECGFKSSVQCRHSSAAHEVVTTRCSGWNWPSGRGAVVVREESAESLLAMDGALGVTEDGIDELVADALMVPFPEVMTLVLPAGPKQRVGPEEDHPVQALVLDGLHESLRVALQFGAEAGIRVNGDQEARDSGASARVTAVSPS